MAGETSVTLIGNITGDPELRFTSSGVAVAGFTVAVQPRQFDKESGKWVDKEASFYRCSAWRQMAENVAESFPKGSRVIVVGTIGQRSYEDREGNKRTTFEVQVDDIGASAKFAQVQVRRPERDQGGQQQRQQGRQQSADPWASSPQGQQSFGSGGTDPWSSAPPRTPAGFADEPPF